jgi:hypothetical protein
MDALLRGGCHQPCLSQLLIPKLPHRRQEPHQAKAYQVGNAAAAQADPPVEKLQPEGVWARVVLAGAPLRAQR